MNAQTRSSRRATDTGIRERIVVGIDDAAHGSGPMQWGCQEAARRNAPLQVVSACPVEVGPPPARPATYLGPDPTDVVLRSLDGLRRRLGTDVEVLPPRVETGTPAQVLVAALDEHALLLVVGRRTRAGAQHLLLGSTSVAVAGRAPVPVIVVPDSWIPDRTASSPVVVGLSGEDDEPLLRFGFEHASSLRVPLVAVHAWGSRRC